MGFQYVLFTLRTCRTNVSGLSNRLTCMPCIQRFVLNNTDNPTFLNQMRWHSAKPQGQLYLLSSKQLRNVHSFTSTAVLNDVILFEHDRTRFFRFLALFCGGQFIFWTYLAYFAFTGLRNTQKNNNGSQKIKAELGLFSFDMNLGSKAWRFGFTLGCLVIAGGIVGLGMLFTCRSVSRVVLHKGGRKVTVSTQSPLGVNKAWCLTVPLNQVACHAHRHESPSFIPLKVKDHKFYFLLDKEGTLNNHKLFDVTVGAYRPL
ncbi:transmembrane protein 223 [Electrophorus electricus]|uniref:Transmembrane protein 223 n=1 Tax=Electrophorus electricus TaxID=8005 RepID=A0A4W4EET4_ELEEL|nr:transmembrane protein 223 [Electrophorus electricus]